MTISITYSDTTTATNKSVWIFDSAKIGADYSTPADDLLIERNIHHIYRRYRFLRGSISFTSQEGQVGTNNYLDSINGTVTVRTKGTQKLASGDTVTIAWYCTDDLIEPVGKYSGIIKQTQVWEFFGISERISIEALIAAGITYADNTAAECGSTDWTLVSYNPGFDVYNSNEGVVTDGGVEINLVSLSNSAVLKRKAHNVLMRERQLNRVTLYSSQDGQIGDTTDLTSSDGDFDFTPPS